MDKKKNFVMTTDKEVAEKLKQSGLTQIENQNGRYVFLNCIEKIHFDNMDKIVFTNKLCF